MIHISFMFVNIDLGFLIIKKDDHGDVDVADGFELIGFLIKASFRLRNYTRRSNLNVLLICPANTNVAVLALPSPMETLYQWLVACHDERGGHFVEHSEIRIKNVWE
ncbi:hypothetical protein L2E82_50341 [Cichorium intybus]|nr:hypothetical protein L2E82_50341 [Cichorium intybus]